MNDASSNAARLADALLQQVALDLAFAQPGSTRVTDSLGDLVDQIAAACDGAPEPIGTAVAACRHWLAACAAADGCLTQQAIASLSEWQPWMATAVLAWGRGQPIAPPPPEWSVAPPAVRAEAEPSQQVSVLPDGVDDDMLQLFCAESQDLLQEVEQAVLVLERNPADKAMIDTVFRVFHTFKGNAGVIKLVVLQRLTHELESLLDAARRGKAQLGRDAIDVILEGADVLRRYVGEMLGQISGVEKGRTIPLPIPALIARVDRLLHGGPAVPAAAASPAVVPAAAAAVSVAPSAPAVPVAVPSPILQPAAEPMAAPVVSSPPPPAAAQSPAEPVAAPAAAVASAMVRVDTHKLDGLIDLVGELVVAQSMVVQSPELKGIGNSQLARCLGQLRGITSDLQRTAMSLRMVPIGGTFRKMARLVRDLSGELGKEIDLKLEGEDTELDRNLVEELSDPLVHMIRNSVDHGIEMPDVRAAAGKPRTGTITLRAFHQGGFIVIQIGDDGRGLSGDRILAKAVERGLVKPQDRLEPADIRDLIFLPGFSTAEKVTGLSGRGVGMDVVRRNIEKIRGKVGVDSIEGSGSTFTMYVPLTLAIIEGLIVGVGQERYIIPTLSVRESFRPLPGAVTTVQGRGEVVRVRGKLTPLLRLGRFLGTPAKTDDPTQGIVVVVESGQDCRCLLVDDLIGKQEVVIKSLGEMFGRQNAFAGAAILGDGRVGLILDVNSLVKMKSATGDAA
jgi:two-component system chemotaxis sensor kinase CheA